MTGIGGSAFPGWKYVRLLVLGCATISCGGVPKPDFVTPFDKVSGDSIRSYLGKLEFDHRDGVGDDQILLLGCPNACRPGPRVAVYPERRSHENSRKSLANGPGRIVATIINLDPKQDYAPLNLRAGDTLYWAVDSVRSAGKTLSRGRSLYISARALRDGRGPAVVARRPLVIDEHPGQSPVKTSLARWIFDTTSYEVETPGGHSSLEQEIWTMVAWGNCKSGGCCR